MLPCFSSLLDGSTSPLSPQLPSGDGPPVPWISIILTVTWPLPALLFWLLDFFITRRRRVVRDGVSSASSTGGSTALRAIASAESELFCDDRVQHCAFAVPHTNGYFPVMLASLEHSLPHLPHAKAVAGGLGKVVDLIARHHPSDILMVHPMLAETEGQLHYGDVYEEQLSLRVVVDGIREDVKVFRHMSLINWQGDDADDGSPKPVRVQFLMLSHPLFEARTRDSVYPNPMSRRAVLSFFSLWNQAVGALLARHKPRVFHCPDFHAAVAPWYALPQWPHLRVLLVLHNAEYQGTISTDMIYGERLKVIASIFNLPVKLVKDHLILDGRFNMLKAGVDFIMERQRGLGVCAVSHWYAAECHSTYGLLWKLPKIDGIDNPMLEEEKAALPTGLGLSEAKAQAKLRLQRRFGLHENVSTRLFVSLGRLVRQKGVDLVADIAPWLLSRFPDAQLVLVGPVGDGFGHYAASKLKKLADDGQSSGRLYVDFEFLRDRDALKDMKLGADFCLMPSRDEPFGYVDIEFAWHGALLVGAQAGGLGKVPGFYYLAQNRENLSRLRRELRSVVSQAMQASTEQLQHMANTALKCQFPLERWQQRLSGLYDALEPVTPDALQESGAGDEPLDSAPGSIIELRHARGRTDTFMPYHTEVASCLMPGPHSSQDQENASQRVSTPVSAVEAAVGAQSSVFVTPSVAPEFMTQELDEKQLADRVCLKVQQHEQMGIDEILESVGADVDAEREGGSIGRWLLGRTFGIQRVHLLVAVGYVASPIAEFLTFVTATEWGLRGTEHIPGWARRFVGNPIDPPLLNMLLFGLNALAFSVSAPFWAALCRYVQPRRLMSASLLLQLPLLAMLGPVPPRIGSAFLLVTLHGLVTSASTLFLVFNFMMSIKADMSSYALRMGALEMMRYIMTWLLTGYIFLASPSSLRGTKEQPLPSAVGLLLLPIGLLMLLLTLVPGVLLLFAPGPYRSDRFPGWDLELFFKKRSFILLFVSECVGSLALFPGTCYISWWLTNGWSSADIASLSCVFAVLLAIGTFTWARALSLASKHGFSFLVGVAVLLAPPMMLRVMAQEEVATIVRLGRSQGALIIGVISLFLEGVRSSAIWTAKIRILNSRWRLLSYGSVLQSCSHFFAFLSPIACELFARSQGVTFMTRNQKELADAMIVSGIPLGLLQFLFQVAAIPFIYKDMGISIGGERSARSLLRKLKRGRSMFAFIVLLVLGLVLSLLMTTFLKFDLPLDRIARCEVSLAANCSVIWDETDPWPAVLGSHHYGINRFGQNTTGIHNCLQQMRAVGGDTFLFWEAGRCQVQLCGSEAHLQSALEVDPGQGDERFDLWSKFCDMSRPDLVAVHLFEWPWADVGRECEEYLGPGGFNAVQVSPPQEHILGDSWSTRYQPVSYRLESRGGNYSEFVAMVSRCRAAGVDVMVDAVLNHMAGPHVFTPKKDRGKECGHTVESPKASTRPCIGWAGTRYGNRVYPHGRPQIDKFDRQMFHHFPSNDRANCGIPPWTNNRHLCDMYGLPDLDTENRNVQAQLRAFLSEMHEIGVTMLRLDAAMMIYQESLAEVVLPLPWEFLVQEYYPDQMNTKRDATKAFDIGHVTDFAYGQRIAQVIFDGGGGSSKWTNRSSAFGELLDLNSSVTPSCQYKLCNSPVPTSRAMVFLDNHDQQRERWKPEAGGPPESPTCAWDSFDIGSCRPMYKHGFMYRLAQLFELACPYGGRERAAVRLMSSFGFAEFNQGPPGVSNDSLSDKPTSPVVCRDTPMSSPVDTSWDEDEEKPWSCEHRWKGVSGLVRFRRALNRSIKMHSSWDDGKGHIGFSLGDVGFVALSRGYNWWTQQGSNGSFPLEGKRTAMPAGCYCNLADELGAVAGPSSWTGRCSGGVIIVSSSGRIRLGQLESGSVVAIHALYGTNATSCTTGPRGTMEVLAV